MWIERIFWVKMLDAGVKAMLSELCALSRVPLVIASLDSQTSLPVSNFNKEEYCYE